MLPTVESAHEVSTSFENASVNLYILFREKKKKMTSMFHLKTATIPVNFIVWALRNNFVVM